MIIQILACVQIVVIVAISGLYLLVLPFSFPCSFSRVCPFIGLFSSEKSLS